MGKWLLYGANGYTGVLIAEEAKRRGLAPILAGRNGEAVRGLAERLSLPHRAFTIEDTAALDAALAEVDAVLLAAGPFSATSRPVVEACLRKRKHYLDITGELDVFEACFARDADAKAAGVVLLPGVGFDVVPSDCLAAALKEAFPAATHLEIALAAGGTPSRGTARTMVELLGKGGRVRENGALRPEPPLSRPRQVPFRDRPRLVVTMPLADLSTAYRSTGIPNITCYASISRRLAKRLTIARPLMGLARLGLVQSGLRALADRAKGSTEEERNTRVSHIWARVSAPGAALEGTLACPEGYRFTALAAVECAERIAAAKAGPGAHSPATAFGWRFATELPETDIRVPGVA
jgi:short subunit dehydrogenase-like uncharacterized protein